MVTDDEIDALPRDVLLGLWGLQPHGPSAGPNAAALRAFLRFTAAEGLPARPTTAEVIVAFRLDLARRLGAGTARNYASAVRCAHDRMFADLAIGPARKGPEPTAKEKLDPHLRRIVKAEARRLLDARDALAFRAAREAAEASEAAGRDLAVPTATLPILAGSAEARAEAAARCDAAVAQAVDAGLEHNSERAYVTALERYVLWAMTLGVGHFPITAKVARRHFAWLIETQAALGRRSPATTLNTAAAALKKVHALRGLPAPWTDGDPAHQSLVKRARALSRPPEQAYVFSRDEIAAICERLDNLGTVTAIRDKAAYLLCYGACTRGSEVTTRRESERPEDRGEDDDGADRWARSIEDVSFNEHGLELRLGKTKTNSAAEAPVVAVSYGADPATCPVLAVRAWIETLAARGVRSGPLFPHLKARGERAAGDVAIGKKPITRATLTHIVKMHAEAVGVSGKVSSHSLRRSHAVNALAAGANPVVVQEQGRWKSLEMVSRYGKGVASRRHNSSQYL